MELLLFKHKVSFFIKKKEHQIQKDKIRREPETLFFLHTLQNQKRRMYVKARLIIFFKQCFPFVL